MRNVFRGLQHDFSADKKVAGEKDGKLCRRGEGGEKPNEKQCRADGEQYLPSCSNFIAFIAFLLPAGDADANVRFHAADKLCRLPDGFRQEGRVADLKREALRSEIHFGVGDAVNFSNRFFNFSGTLRTVQAFQKERAVLSLGGFRQSCSTGIAVRKTGLGFA